MFPGAVEILGDERVSMDDHRIPCPGSRRSGIALRRRAGVGHLVEVGNIGNFQAPFEIVDGFQYLVRRLLRVDRGGGSCRLRGWRCLSLPATTASGRRLGE